MKRTVAGGTSPIAVTLCPSITVENAEEEPNRVAPEFGFFGTGVEGFVSTNTETEASPSVNTRWATGLVAPGMS